MIVQKKFIFTLFIFSLTISWPSFVCGGSSGAGGVSIRYQQNPWFLQNTKKITYCINVNLKEFSASAGLVDQSFQKAFSYWQEHLAFAVNDSNEILKVATQQLVRVSCKEHTDPDISLQMGHLSSEQKSFIPINHNYIAIAQMTKYEKTLMQGKGFIYIIGDKNSPMKDQWSKANGHALTMTLIHELGHIFGFKHESGIEVMRESYPDEMFYLSEKQLSQESIFQHLYKINDPLAKNNKQRIVLILDEKTNYPAFEAFQNIFPDHVLNKYIIEFHKEEQTCVLDFFTSNNDGTKYYQLGRAKNVSYIPKKNGFVSIRIPPKRSVFLNLPTEKTVDGHYYGYHFVLEESYIIRLVSNQGENFLLANYKGHDNSFDLHLIKGYEQLFMGNLRW